MSPRTDPPSPAASSGAGPSPAGAGAAVRAERRSRGTAGFAVRCAPALAAGLALAALAIFQADRGSAAETAFLALWVTAALLPAAVLAPSPGREALLAAPLAVLAVWALPAGPARLAAVGVLLAAVIAIAGGRAVARGLAPSLILPLALGAQVLLRSELLLAPDARAVALLIVAPALAALALARLAMLAGLPAALIAGAAAITLGPGFTAVTVLALLGVAAGAEIAAWIAGGARSWVALALPAAGLAAGLAVETRATGAALIAGHLLVLAARGRRAARAREHQEASRDRERRVGLRERLAGRAPPATPAVVLALSLIVVARPLALRSLPGAFAVLSWLPLLLPAALLLAYPASSRETGRWAPGLAAAALGWACACAVPGPAAPAAALAVLAVLAVAPPGAAGVGETAVDETAAAAAGGVAPAVRWVVAAQSVWSAALLAAVAVLASPPWLRPLPAAEAVRLLDVEPGWPAAAVVAVAVLIWAAIGRSGAVRFVRSPAAWAGGALAAVSLGAVLAALPGPVRPLDAGPAAVLSPERPRMAVELEGAAVTTIAVYTHLSNGLGLAAGTEVATVALLDEDGRTLARRPLRAGIDTGEWAVRRPDVAALPGIEAPAPWAVWIEGGGGPGGSSERPFFGQYYRALVEAETARLVVERAAALPDEVLITVHRIEAAG